MRDGDHITREALAAELDRICESPAFRHSLRHQQFLRHLLACKEAGRFAALREIALGIDFFHRPASTYDPKSDPVVRVEAGRLRQRLDRYYHGAGAAAPFEILLDKGSYVPVLRVRAAAAVAIGAQPSVAVLPLAPISATADPHSAAGLADEIAQTLSRLPQLRVFGPESPIAADVAASVAEARDRFKVEWIVRGRWLDDAPRMLLLEVIGTASGDTLLALRIDTAVADALAIHHRIRTEMLHYFVPLLAVRDGGDTLAAAPRDAAVRCAFATFLMYSARFDESLREYDVVQALDPLDPAIRCQKGALYFYGRCYDRAETLLTQAIEMSPHDLYARLLLADTYAQSGRPEESLEASRQLVAIAPDYANSHVYEARALQMLGREEEAAAIVIRAHARFDDTAITEYEEAMLHVARGNLESALDRLERHALRKANGAHCIVIDPTFAVLHRHPRWRSMLERVGLPDFSSRV